MNTKTFLKVFNSIETVLTGLVRTIVNIFTFAITEVAPMVAPLRDGLKGRGFMIFNCQIMGVINGKDIGHGEALLRGHIGSIKPRQDADCVRIGISKEKLLEIIADSLETEDAEISINFGDIRLLIPSV